MDVDVSNNASLTAPPLAESEGKEGGYEASVNGTEYSDTDSGDDSDQYNSGTEYDFSRSDSDYEPDSGPDVTTTFSNLNPRERARGGS